MALFFYLCYNMLMDKNSLEGPIVLAVLDGVGYSTEDHGNALIHAKIPFLRKALSEYPTFFLNASGEYVGISRGTMGNSEVGHNTIGTGQIVRQGIENVNFAFESGDIFRSRAWLEAMNRCKSGATLHFSGIFSDGGVHGHIDHLEKLITEANREGIMRIRLHLVFDGRDVAPQSEPKFISRIEEFLSQFDGCDYRIADGGGRMVYVADRYMSDWGMVKVGYDAMVHGASDRYFHFATEAIETLRRENPSVQDQYLPSFVITDDENKPVGVIEEGDALIYTDFRADRAIEIAMAFTYEDFPYFDRGFENNRRPDILFVGMTEYDSRTHVPEFRLVEPIVFDKPLNAFLGEHGISQFAVSETVKFGHITYYFNGNSYDVAPGEVHEKIPSYERPFNECPWMKSMEIADSVINACDHYRFIRCNFPGGDMVGHLGELAPTVIALDSIDLALARIAKKVDELGGILLITADHGNCEELLDENNNPKTYHTTNLVPFIIYDNTDSRRSYRPANIQNPGLANIASTIADLFGLPTHPDSWHDSLIKTSL